MLTYIGLGRCIPQPQIDSQHQPIVVQSTKYSKQTSSSSTVDDSEFVNVPYRSRPCYSPIRPNSLILSSQNSSQKSNSLITTSTENEQIIDDDNEKYYSAQSSKLSTPMIHSIGLSSCIKTSDDKLLLSSILDIDSEEQKTHQTKILPPKIENKNFHISHHILEKDFLH